MCATFSHMWKWASLRPPGGDEGHISKAEVTRTDDDRRRSNMDCLELPRISWSIQEHPPPPKNRHP